MTLSLMVMTAVLSTYVFLARNFTRSLGLTSSNQPTLNSQSRRVLSAFAQDVQMASAISGIPGTNSATFVLPTGSGTKSVAYYFNSTAAPVPTTLAGYSTSVPAMSLVRVDGSSGATLTLHSNLLTFTISYYDASGGLYTVFSDSVAGFSSYLGIKQVGIDFTAQAGSATNGTLTQIFSSASPRLLLRNKGLLP